MQNIISRDTDEFRKQFIARPGHKLIVVDMGQQETRIAAYVSQDKALMEILQDIKQDVFIGMAKMIYKKDITKDDPFRKQVKNTAYGINYGMSAEGMADRYGMTLDEAEEAIHLYFKTFSGFHGWVMQQRQKTNYVETIAGRRVWLNPYSMQCERNALNDPISGSAADQMKMALGNIHQKWHDEIPEVFGFPCVGYIHDELIFDVPAMYAEKVAKFVQREMISAAELMCPGVPFTATPKICDNWAEGK
jgi:DNA polymerase-1